MGRGRGEGEGDPDVCGATLALGANRQIKLRGGDPLSVEIIETARARASG